jgi:hypothetical protein
MTTAIRIALLLFVSFAAFAQSRPTRLSWQEFAKDPTRVQSLRNAVAKMKSRNSLDPTSVEFRKSWVYWASMHGYFGTNAKAGTVAQWRTANNLNDPKWDPYFAGVPNTAPPDSVAQTVWDQCQHGTDYFFAWHRMFLYYFERVLQDAANDKSLRLPYWDYTNPNQLAMPAEFASPTYVNAQGQTVDNPLYEPRRLPGWDTTRRLSSVDTNIDLALDKTQLLGGNQYQSTIEQRPHGYTHCAVMTCRATTMGAVPYSSNDPIFWIHHCNIDRLWDCWTSIPGHTSPASVLDKAFTYINEQGQLVRDMTVRKLPIDYVYQQASNCQRGRVSAVADEAPQAPSFSASSVRQARTALREPVLIGESATPLPIDAQRATRRVSFPATASLSHPRQFALEDQEALPVLTELILRGVRFRQHPGASFTIHLQRTDDPSRRALVGTLAIFSEGTGAHAEHGGAVDDLFTFDATDALRELDLEGTGTLNVDVVFEAQDEPVGDDFEPAESGLVVGEIEFHVKRDL